MSEIATRTLFASAQSKMAISEHAQEHAPPFRAAVLDTSFSWAIFPIVVFSCIHHHTPE